MMNKKKKITIISTIVILSFTIMGIVYALLSDKEELNNKLTVGSVHIENSNLSLRKSNGEETSILEPADIDTLSWTTENVGTSGALTRHTLEIYWKDMVEEDANKLLYLYPANISKEAILEDFKNEGKLQLHTEKVSKEIDGEIRYGVKYQFVGDTLNGTDMKDVNKEVNYNYSLEDIGNEEKNEINSDVENNEINLDTQNSIGNETNLNEDSKENNKSQSLENITEEEKQKIIDKNVNTDDNESNTDEIAFRVLLSPKTSYLFQGKEVSIKVTTEAVQYTEDGSENWTIVAVDEIS